MKFTIERAGLLKALGHVQSVVERRNTIPILSNVLISAERGGVAFSATDLDMEIVDFAQAQVDTPGQITASAHTLYEIARKLPEGADVELRYTGDDPRLQPVKKESWSERLHAVLPLANAQAVDASVAALLKAAWERS